MAFDLKAATAAAQAEASRAPFEFDWGDEHFSIAPMAEWPLEISATFAAFAGDVDKVDPVKVFEMMELIVGPETWPRFARTVPLDAIPVLIKEMSTQGAGTTMPDLSLPPELVSTPT